MNLDERSDDFISSYQDRLHQEDVIVVFMTFFRTPTDNDLRQFQREQAQKDLNYSGIRRAFGTLPCGYTIDHIHIRLGNGKQVLQSSKMAL